MDVLLICTANQCRTPMAEGLLRARLRRAGITANVGSAGLLPGGMPATPAAVDVLADRGIDISGHVSRNLDAQLVENADLVLGMTRAHAREAVVLVPSAFPRIFTVKELVRRAGIGGGRDRGEAGTAWLASLGAQRAIEDLLGSDQLDDIADPIGQPRKAYEATADELDEWLGRVVDAVWPRQQAESP